MKRSSDGEGRSIPKRNKGTFIITNENRWQKIGNDDYYVYCGGQVNEADKERIVRVKIAEGVDCINNSPFGDDGTFENCRLLEDIEFLSPPTSSSSTLTCICTRSFYNCSLLMTINIPSTVMVIGVSAFENCTSLANVTLPRSLDIIMEKMFAHCRNLSSIVLPENCQEIHPDAFSGCSSLKSIIFPDSLLVIGSQVRVSF